LGAQSISFGLDISNIIPELYVVVMQGMRPASFSTELKRKIAASYLENRKALEELEPAALESFASELLEMVARRKKKPNFSTT